MEKETKVIYKTTWLSLTKTMGFIHSFIQQVFVKHVPDTGETAISKTKFLFSWAMNSNGAKQTLNTETDNK